MRRWLIAALVVCSVGLHPRRTTGDMVWVSNGRPMATVILPDDPYPIAEYAAQELVYHVHQATGVELPVVREHQAAMVQGGRIYVGGSRAATLAGIEHQHLDDEVFVVRGATDDVLYITGRDGDGAPLSDGNIHSGTLWGVYEVVERVLQARWLWPGELGTHVPRTGTVVCPPLRHRDSAAVRPPADTFWRVLRRADGAYAGNRARRGPGYGPGVLRGRSSPLPP